MVEDQLNDKLEALGWSDGDSGESNGDLDALLLPLDRVFKE